VQGLKTGGFKHYWSTGFSLYLPTDDDASKPFVRAAILVHNVGGWFFAHSAWVRARARSFRKGCHSQRVSD
jgi:hypothetical protein